MEYPPACWVVNVAKYLLRKWSITENTKALSNFLYNYWFNLAFWYLKIIAWPAPKFQDWDWSCYISSVNILSLSHHPQCTGLKTCGYMVKYNLRHRKILQASTFFRPQAIFARIFLLWCQYRCNVHTDPVATGSIAPLQAGQVGGQCGVRLPPHGAHTVTSPASKYCLNTWILQ